MENAKEHSQITIFNTIGQIIKQIPILDSMVNLNIDLSDLENGLYFVKLDDGYKVITKKLSLIRQ